jgi:hypothetical protein
MTFTYVNRPAYLDTFEPTSGGGCSESWQDKGERLRCSDCSRSRPSRWLAADGQKAVTGL